MPLSRTMPGFEGIEAVAAGSKLCAPASEREIRIGYWSRRTPRNGEIFRIPAFVVWARSNPSSVYAVNWGKDTRQVISKSGHTAAVSRALKPRIFVSIPHRRVTRALEKLRTAFPEGERCGIHGVLTVCAAAKMLRSCMRKAVQCVVRRQGAGAPRAIEIRLPFGELPCVLYAESTGSDAAHAGRKARGSQASADERPSWIQGCLIPNRRRQEVGSIVCECAVKCGPPEFHRTRLAVFGMSPLRFTRQRVREILGLSRQRSGGVCPSFPERENAYEGENYDRNKQES
jgi:hypothetical protein